MVYDTNSERPPPRPRPIRLAATVLVLGMVVTGGCLLAAFPDHRPLIAGIVLGVGGVCAFGLWVASRVMGPH